MTATIDLNADLGEQFGVYGLGDDAAMLALVSSANIACGLHAGDPDVMARAAALAATAGVAIGAHPGLPDLQGFGRRVLILTPDEAANLVAYQIGALAAFVRRQRQELQHVKPHGALYHMAENDRALARAVAGAVRDWDTQMIVYGQSGGLLIEAARDIGLAVAQEVFADRAYQSDGTLTPRGLPGALVLDPAQAAARMVRLIREGIVEAVDGTELRLDAATICLHGDTPGTVLRARRLRDALAEHRIAVSRPSIEPPGFRPGQNQ
jgi:UPF0271 protein